MTTSEHPNATAYRKTVDAFRAGDLATLRDLIHEDVLWHVPGRDPMAGDVRGRDALFDWLGRLRAYGFTIREHDVFGNDEHVCALSYIGAKRPGVDIETRVTSVFHFRDGLQVERWMYPEEAATWDAIFTVPGKDRRERSGS
jgi:ketosteroid isomerase-like protein